MKINMQTQFQKLKNIVKEVDVLYFGLNIKEYLGPVNPVSIVTLVSSSGIVTINYLVLAEGVPALYLPSDFDPNHLEAVTVYLDENFEFRDYNAATRELRQLSFLVGDKAYSYDGTVNGSGVFFKNNNWKLDVLYHEND